MANTTGGELNTNQKEAVQHKDGPLLVVAGAGTGKTRVIVERIAKLIKSGVKADSILALTFTEKAATEMLDRVNELRGGYTLDATITTYNTFGSMLLRQYAPDIGISEHVQLLGETGQIVFLREHLDELKLDYYAPVSKPDSQLQTLAKHFSRLKQQLVNPETYLNYAKAMPSANEEEVLERNRHVELAKAYKAYMDLCHKHSVIDYDDQIYLVVDLLNRRPNIKKQLRDRYQYILVDEFQDTNPMQSKLLDMVCGPQQNIMVVGDDDQSIYGWRGATLANLLDFTKRYPKTKEIALIKNYRSSQRILDSAYAMIQNNNPNRLEVISQLDKKLVSNADSGHPPQVFHFPSLNAELSWIAEDISEKIKKGIKPGSIAVLIRRNALLDRVHDMLSAKGIENIVAGRNIDLYKQPAVANLIEALKAIHDPSDNVALFHTLGSSFFNINPHILADASSASRKKHEPMLDILKAGKDQAAKKAIGLLNDFRGQSHQLSVRQLALGLLTKTGLKDELLSAAETDETAATQVQALGQYFETLSEFERVSDTPSLVSYILNLEALRSSGAELEDYSMQLAADAVNVLSVHRAKGLEWDTVYIPDCTEDSFPLRKFGSSLDVPEELKVHSEADDHMAEERRLMYVAATRAKRDLVLTHCDTHNYSTRRRPSRFIGELLGQDYKEILQKEDSPDRQLLPNDSKTKVTIPSRMVSGDKLVLTASQVDKFLYCELDFYYRYILNVPEALDPTLARGTVIHDSIQKINEGLIRGDIPSLESLLESAENRWPTEGYASAKQRDDAHEQGIATIKQLYSRLTSENRIPAYVEKDFRVEVPDSLLILIGRMDVVFDTEEGAEIRDYKTGDSVKDDAKAKQRTQRNVQLSLYALAWRIENGELPAKLVLDFVETEKEGSVKKQPKTIDKLETKLAAIPDKIRSGNYQPGSDHTYCVHPID